MFEIRNYLTETGRDIFTEWHIGLKDHKARRAIDRRQLNEGNDDEKPITR